MLPKTEIHALQLSSLTLKQRHHWGGAGTQEALPLHSGLCLRHRVQPSSSHVRKHLTHLWCWCRTATKLLLCGQNPEHGLHSFYYPEHELHSFDTHTPQGAQTKPPPCHGPQLFSPTQVPTARFFSTLWAGTPRAATFPAPRHGDGALLSCSCTQAPPHSGKQFSVNWQ